MKYNFKVEKPQKLLSLLSDNIAQISLGALKSLLKAKEIRVNGIKVTADCDLNVGDEASVFVPQKMINSKSPEIIFEDENLLVVNKPILTDVERHLVSELAKCGKNDLRPVHRLDRNTTGLVMLAKNDLAYEQLSQAIAARKIEKYYRAVVYGRPSENNAVLKAYLKKDADKSLCYISDKPLVGYVPIVTSYKIIEENAPLYVLEVQAITGRTHQLRAHLSSIGCPIIGDGKYGNMTANKQFGFKYQQLCAVRLVLGGLGGAYKYLNGKEIVLPY